jgi:predicted ATPase
MLDRKTPFITEFSIYGLFGYKDLSLKFKNSVQIYIGENGFGKTTILNAFYYLLKGEYQKLNAIRFSKIKIVLGGQEFEFEKQILNNYCTSFKEKQRFFKSNLEEIELKEFGVFLNIKEQIKNSEYTLIYFPTYRRIEEELKNLSEQYVNQPLVVQQFQEGLMSNDKNLIQFGMKDVEERISKILEKITSSSLTGFATVSGEMVGELLKDHIEEQQPPDFKPEEIQIVLSRMGDKISPQSKQFILDQIESQNKEWSSNFYMVKFIQKLLNVYEKQKEWDTAIKRFSDTCNTYLSEKKFYYDESAVTLTIYREIAGELEFDEENKIALKQLSSGEKQIVSIMAQLYLEIDKRFIILIDEPELSLSIYWQEKLLPDIMVSERCNFMMAVTHSPFIFDNELKPYAIGLNEFLINGKE